MSLESQTLAECVNGTDRTMTVYVITLSRSLSPATNMGNRGQSDVVGIVIAPETTAASSISHGIGPQKLAASRLKGCFLIAFGCHKSRHRAPGVGSSL